MERIEEELEDLQTREDLWRFHCSFMSFTVFFWWFEMVKLLGEIGKKFNCI
jgi:hypothetical protein